MLFPFKNGLIIAVVIGQKSSKYFGFKVGKGFAAVVCLSLTAMNSLFVCSKVRLSH